MWKIEGLFLPERALKAIHFSHDTLKKYRRVQVRQGTLFHPGPSCPAV
jgi:hypothetical protein